MKPYDILLIQHTLCPIAWLIRLTTKSEWNHVALVLNETQLIHMKATGLAITPLKQYLNKLLYKTKLLRLKRPYKDRIPYLTGITRKVVSKQKRYTYFNFLKSGILLFLGKKIERETCSSFVAKIYSKIDICFNLKKELSQILPEDINQCKLFRKINLP